MEEQLKEFIRELLVFIRKCCPSMMANEMFALEDRAKQLGV